MNEDTAKEKIGASIVRLTEELEKVRSVSSSALDRALTARADNHQGDAWAILYKVLGDIRHELGPGEFFTPQEAIDVVLANPPMGEIGPAAAAPSAASEEHHMSRIDAARILGIMAANRKRTPDEVTALQMGALRLIQKHFQRHRNYAKRRANSEEESQA